MQSRARCLLSLLFLFYACRIHVIGYTQNVSSSLMSRIAERPPGEQLSGRIAFGTRAVPGGHPYLVSVRIITGRTRNGIMSMHHCGGTIISPFWVVSSAHCFRETILTANDILIRVGEYDMTIREAYELDYEVGNIIIPPSFNTVSYDADIALLYIPRGIRLRRGIIDTADLPSENTQITPKDRCFVSGWGDTEQGITTVVREAQLQILDQAGQARCRNTYFQQRTITPSMFCAGSNTDVPVDTCLGDSGGPFICLQNGRRVLIGITSWGVMECGLNTMYPGVYTDVRVLRRWIRNNAGL